MPEKVRNLNMKFFLQLLLAVVLIISFPLLFNDGMIQYLARSVWFLPTVFVIFSLLVLIYLSSIILWKFEIDDKLGIITYRTLTGSHSLNNSDVKEWGVSKIQSLTGALMLKRVEINFFEAKLTNGQKVIYPLSRKYNSLPKGFFPRVAKILGKSPRKYKTFKPNENSAGFRRLKYSLWYFLR